MTSVGHTRLRLQATLFAMLAAGLAGNALAQAGTPEAVLKSATETARKIKEATGAKTAVPPKKLAVGDPCTVLSLPDVRKALPQAKAGERSRRLEQYGITECAWKGADGQLLLGLQEHYGRGSARKDVEGMASGIVDPLSRVKPVVKIETFAGIGEDVAAFVEPQDIKRGIVDSMAYMSVRRGDHSITLISAELTLRDRAAALKAFEELARVVIKRLD